jgi:trimethylguanosine synthase
LNQADVVFLSPPWGGPDYNASDLYCLELIQLAGGEVDGLQLFRRTRTITENIAYFLPKNTYRPQLLQLAVESGQGTGVEMEEDFLNHKLKAVTAYYGTLVGRQGLTNDKALERFEILEDVRGVPKPEAFQPQRNRT